MGRRGFLAELQHQARVSARNQARSAREAERDYRAAARRAEAARKADVRAAKAWERASAADRKRLEKEARAAHLESRRAEAEQQNEELAEIYSDLDTLLESTLDADDYVDLETLRVMVEHPPFPRKDLERPLPPPEVLHDPPQPTAWLPPRPTGVLAVFSKGKHAKAVAEAEADYQQQLAAWRDECARQSTKNFAAVEARFRGEAERTKALAAARARYADDCAARDTNAAAHNKSLDALIANLGYGTVDAVHEYLSIVLSNSVYPDHFSVDHEFEFEPSTAELKLRVIVPGPDVIPTIKAYKYTVSSDEISSSNLSQKACKDRYAGVVHQVALRSLREVFNADRRGLIKTITVEVGTQANSPATGLEVYVAFVSAAAERRQFLALNLANVVPAATLAHLGASVSKDPFGLVAADLRGVRRS